MPIFNNPGSSIGTPDSPRRRWDERYANFSSKDRRQPTAFVRAYLPQLPQQGHALDVAAGAGRHSLALARHGLRVDAIDISAQGLSLAQQRAQEAGAAIHFIVADVERPWLPHRAYDVILVSYFLYRPLFPLIKTRLCSGGWLIYETLTVAQKEISSSQPLRPEFLLKPGELKDAFADLEILLYDEGQHERGIAAQLLARKL
ncbi:MAG: methyltransferase domain-containing protein [Anaerolineae bacterium]